MRPFGFAEDRVTVIEQEAVVIREAAARVLAGESLSSVCRDLARRDVQTPAGNHWQPRTLRRLLASARISGRREHTPKDSWTGTRPLLGEIVAEVAAWPAIIAPADSDRLRVLLSRPERRTTTGPMGRTYLLSGLLRCARCGAGMVGRPKAGTPRYVCPNVPGGKSCGGTATVAGPTDEHVRDLVLSVLDNPEVAERLRRRDSADTDLAARLREDEDRLAGLAADYGAGEITRAEWKAARDVIAARVETARARLARSTRSNALESFLGTREVMAARWQEMNTAQRRAVVAAAVESIAVRPASSSGRRFDRHRFEPVWR